MTNIAWCPLGLASYEINAAGALEIREGASIAIAHSMDPNPVRATRLRILTEQWTRVET